MLKNHWYAVEFGAAVDLAPHRIRVFGHDLVLYRDCLGALVCHSDVCVHCGQSLAAGAITGDRLRCGTCGREYDLDGVCTLIPELEPGAMIPVDARVDSYPSVEQYGFVFVFLGDLPGNRRPPGPRLPVLDVMPYAQAHDHRVISGEVAWGANYERVIEHTVAIDRIRVLPATGESADGAAAVALDTPVDDYEIEESHVGLWLTGVTGAVTLPAVAATGLRKLTASRPDAAEPTRAGVFFPNLTFVETPVPGGTIRIVTAVVPVDAERSISKWTMYRTFAMSSIGDSAAKRRMRRVIDADRVAIEAGPPGPIPYHPDDEHEPLDAVRAAYRAWRQTVLSWGWGIEAAPAGGFDDWASTRMIPSPARRFPPDSPDAWVLQEMGPLEVHRDA